MNGFYSRNNLHYCPDDYQKLFSVKCDGCGELAEGEVMTVLGKSFHHHCFKCSKCRLNEAHKYDALHIQATVHKIIKGFFE